MKRVLRTIPLFALTAALIISTVAVASGGPPGGGFYSGQTVMNVGSGAATVNVSLIDSVSGASVGNKTYNNIGVGSAVSFSVNDIAVLSSFQGSAVVSSDQPVRAIVNITNRPSGSFGIAGGTASAQYGGVDSASTGTKISFPLAKAAFGVKTSAFYIQNAGGSNATFVATFIMGTSLTDPSPVTYVYTSTSLLPGQMAVIVAGDAGAPAGRIGSLTVTSGQPLAGTVLEYETSTSPALILQGTTGLASGDYDSTIMFPVVKKQLSGRSTGLQVQNVSGGTVSVVMSYKGAPGSACAGLSVSEAPVNLAPNQSTTYLDSTLLPAGCLASATATTSTPGGLLAGVVNEAFLPCSGCTQRATMYHAFAAKNATNTVLAPVFKTSFGNKTTGLSIQDTSGVGATATVTFTVGANNYVYNNLAIPAGGSALLLNVTNPAVYPDANWTGGAAGRLPTGTLAAVTVHADQAIIGIANEAPINGLLQDNINYEAFNK